MTNGQLLGLAAMVASVALAWYVLKNPDSARANPFL